MSLSTADRLEILDLINRADTAASDRDVDAYVALFTADAVLDGDQGNYAGAEAMRRGVEQVWAAEPRGTLHLTLNAIVDEVADGSLRVRSQLLLVNAATAEILRTARIVQVPQPVAGSWRIARRTVHA